jgi:hypothetical protein
MNQRRIRALIGFMIALQLVLMVTKAEEWSVVRRIDKTTQEHSIVLASHGKQLDSIVRGRFSDDFLEKIRVNYNATR